MDGEALRVQPQTLSGRTGRQLLLCISIFLLLTVVVALSWLCLGVTRLGGYTVVGPGYAGKIRMSSCSLKITPGWTRKVTIDLNGFSLQLQLPDRAAGFSLPVEPGDTSDPQGLKRITCTHHAGFVLVTESAPTAAPPSGFQLQ